MPTATPAIDGWFTTGDEPRLIGTRCGACGTVFFPKTTGVCRNPECFSADLGDAELSRVGKVWSYTDAQYQPPPPYIAADDYAPFAIAAVELADEAMVILGQVADGFSVDDLEVGTEVEIVIETLYTDDDGNERTIYRWKPCSPLPGRSGRR